MSKNVFWVVLCVVFGLQGTVAVFLWAAGSADCPYTKPKLALCDQSNGAQFGSCSQTPDNAPCGNRSITYNHQGMFGSQSDKSSETSVGINAAAMPVPCLTVSKCYVNNDNSCVTDTNHETVMKTQPLKAYQCQ